jgi:pimeloyl-ACP methyl ester carboxylesterase
MSLTHETGFIAALASVASGQRGNSPEVRAHSASEDARGRAGDTRPEPGSSARAAPVSVYFETFAPAAASAKATVVMVHGGAHSGACYQRTADGRSGWAYRFAEHGYRVVVPDWPGTGRSGYIGLDKLDGATVVEGLGALIRSLGAPVVLLAHSMSGPYGWRLLELHGDVIDTVVGVAPGPPGNIQKAAPVHAESETHIETEAFGGRVRVDKSAPVVGSRDFVERKLVGASRYFPRDRLESYAASLNAIAPKLWLERQNIHGSQLRVGDPRKLAGKRVLVITGTDDLDHSRGADGAIVAWLKEQGAKADFCFLADRGIVGNGHMLMLEQNSDEIAGIILDWLEAAR